MICRFVVFESSSSSETRRAGATRAPKESDDRRTSEAPRVSQARLFERACNNLWRQDGLRVGLSGVSGGLYLPNLEQPQSVNKNFENFGQTLVRGPGPMAHQT